MRGGINDGLLFSERLLLDAEMFLRGFFLLLHHLVSFSLSFLYFLVRLKLMNMR